MKASWLQWRIWYLSYLWTCWYSNQVSQTSPLSLDLEEYDEDSDRSEVGWVLAAHESETHGSAIDNGIKIVPGYAYSIDISTMTVSQVRSNRDYLCNDSAWWRSCIKTLTSNLKTFVSDDLNTEKINHNVGTPAGIEPWETLRRFYREEVGLWALRSDHVSSRL